MSTPAKSHGGYRDFIRAAQLHRPIYNAGRWRCVFIAFYCLRGKRSARLRQDIFAQMGELRKAVARKTQRTAWLTDCNFEMAAIRIISVSTAQDTAMLSARLEPRRLPGNRVGHGLGLPGALRAGSAAAATDAESIDAARARSSVPGSAFSPFPALQRPPASSMPQGAASIF